MVKRKTPLVVGNWKMNPESLGLAKKLFLNIRNGLGKRKTRVEIVLAPPYPFISEMERLAPRRRILLGAQDVFSETGTAHTGEVSLPMLRSVGVSHVIVGHSERRSQGESDVDIYKDVQLLLKYKTTAIVCVGEKHRDSHGNYFGVVEAELRAAFNNVKSSQLSDIVIAYEPVWAIGTGKNATPEDAHEMKLFIQKVLTDRFNRKVAGEVRILYGGSVTAQNAKELLEGGEVDGFLVGGASLRAKDFVTIVNTVEAYAKGTARS